MEVPSLDPQAKAKSDRRSQLADVMEQAVRHYRLQLRTGAAAQARDYLAGRGLDDETLETFEIEAADKKNTSRPSSISRSFKNLTKCVLPAPPAPESNIILR